MTPTYLLKFNTYTFPACFHIASTPGDSALQVEQVPYRDGAIVSTPRVAEKIIEIRGMLYSDGSTDLRTKIDALNAALNTGRQKLYLHADRFIYAIKKSFTISYDPSSFDRYCDVSITFVCDTGLYESETESSDTWASPASGGTRVVASAGNASALPVYALTFATAGTANVRLACGSLYFTLTGAVGVGDVIQVDAAAKTVKLASSGADKMLMFDGTFFGFAPGDNTLTYTYVSGPVVSQIVTTWRDRWY